jgi:hypothetical protein
MQGRKESLPHRQAPDLTMRGSCYANTAKRFSPVQSIFSPAARRDTLRERANLDRRDGELKMDWTKPTHDLPNYVF